MSRPSFSFRALGVRRMPGITDGGWELPDLSPGVNVVWGPNGAGKTTTAGAVERLLWPAAFRDGRPQLDARVVLDGAEWRVELDGTTPRWQRDGQDAPAPGGIPSDTERDRYRISLHELLTETDRGLAERILHESAGGFDVAGAAQELGFRKGASNPYSVKQGVRTARERVRTVRDAQARLREDEARLGTLRNEAAGHQVKARRQELCQRALDRLDAMEQEERARDALARFPAEAAYLAGGEAEQLRELRGALAAAEARALAARRDIEDARRALTAAGLPADGLPGDVITRLSTSLQTLQELEQTRRRLEQELERAREVCRAERASLTGVVGDEQMEALTLPAVDELLRFARDAEQHRADLRAADAELAWLGDPSPAESADTLSRGRYLLSEWLRLPDGSAPSRARTAALAGAVLAAVAGTALGVLVHPAGWALVAAAAVLAWFALSAPGAGQRTAKQEEYARLGLDAPVRWEPEPVTALIERIETRIEQARRQDGQAERRRAVERRRADLEARAEEIVRRRAELAARLGLAPETDEVAVAWLCQRVHGWQVAQRSVRQAEAALRATALQYAAASAEAGKCVQPYMVGEVSTPAEVAGTVEDLRSRRAAHVQARDRLQSAETRLGDAEAEADRRRAECTALLARAGLPADADDRLEELCRMHPTYAAARERHVGAQQEAVTATRRLHDTAGFTEAVLAQPRPAVQNALEDSREAATRFERAAAEMAALEERLRAARERTDLEEALAQAQDAEAALRECRERDQSAVAGWVLREYVERETRDRDRPEVFHRARRLFARITRGRYRLELSDAAAEFRAVDTATGTGCALEELSRGTRVQLLLAVRIAFIETMESGARLPLVLDEALGNSDDQRAEAIIDAVVELARDGRQVFFLTARQDEAERWTARLRDSAVDHRLIDLGETRRMARFGDLPPLPATTLRLHAVPAPGEMDHAAYGAVLRVPPIDPYNGGADGVHLWYLVDDPTLLHRILSLGAETWGGLRNLVDAVGSGLLGPDQGGYTRLQALAGAMERLLQARRIGRGRPVDREALERSGAISQVFMGRVEEKRQEVNGDPERLLAAVDGLPRFRDDALAAFREFLEREGYLDSREPLEEARVRVELLAALAPDLRAGNCTPADVDRLLILVAAPN
jgi:uncharacterized protein YhaN